MSKQSQDAGELSRLFMAVPDSSTQMVIKGCRTRQKDGQYTSLQEEELPHRALSPGLGPGLEKKSLFMQLIRFKFNSKQCNQI